MIARGTHHVTQLRQVIVTCDTHDCTQAMYVPGAETTETAAQRATDLGWQTAERHPIGLFEYDALCPEHATTTPEACTHDSKHARHIDGDTRCGKCGRTTNTRPKPPGLRPAAALAALLARQPNGSAA